MFEIGKLYDFWPDETASIILYKIILQIFKILTYWIQVAIASPLWFSLQ